MRVYIIPRFSPSPTHSRRPLCSFASKTSAHDANNVLLQQVYARLRPTDNLSVRVSRRRANSQTRELDNFGFVKRPKTQNLRDSGNITRSCFISQQLKNDSERAIFIFFFIIVLLMTGERRRMCT